MLNSRSLAVIIGTLSLLLGLWSLLGDIPQLGMAAGAVGFVAGLVALLPLGTHWRGDHASEAGGHPGPVAGASPTVPATPSGTGAAAHLPTPASGPGPITPSAEDPVRPDHRPERALPGAALSDEVSGLFSEEYLEVALDSRLASARRHLRPVALAVIQVTAGLPDLHTPEPGRAGPGSGGRDEGAMHAGRPAVADPATVADAIRRTIRESDIACRLRDGTYAVILEDTPEAGAVWTVERIRRNLVGRAGHHTVWAGIACYPAHAFDAPELRAQVEVALSAAREWNQDRIEVAAAH